MPDFTFENGLWKKGVVHVAGCDEVGRGCFAGPVVAGAVVFSTDIEKRIIDLDIKIDDSKKLTVKQRNVANRWIRENSLAYGVGLASVSQINKLGIVKATQIAMRRSIENCEIAVEHLLIDAFYLPYAKGISKKKQIPIIKGDSKSFSIAAASILAKVYRDALMNKIGERQELSVYELHVNKGYGTKAHREAILKHGTTSEHRTQFVNTFLSKVKK